MKEFKLGLIVITICFGIALFLSWLADRDDKLFEQNCQMVETLQGQEVICQ